ncbi:hypothetical protein [Actinophytocola sediminis]
MTYGTSGPVWGRPMPAVRRPGTLTAAGVLGFVAAGIEIIGGIIWLAGGAMISSVEDTAAGLGGETSGTGGVIVLLGVLSLAVGGCYIWGGVSAQSGRNSQVLTVVAAIALGINLIALVFAAPTGLLGFLLAAVTIGLVLAPANRAFVRSVGGKTF